MSIEVAREYLAKHNLDGRIKEYEQSSATVELAAEAEGVIPARICKTISFKSEDGAILICTAGDTKIDNRKFKDFFGFKAKMLSPEQVIEYTNHEIGGVCPFGVTHPKTKIYTDVSIKRFQSVFPAAGSGNSSIEFTPKELFEISNSLEWIDVCKIPEVE
jgi:prolyl-tRNA editing enzyme YbaK/EbsC (Cys-tRNA(Pro) deacylase)